MLTFLLELGKRCMSCPIEIEFAANLGESPEFCVLQIRPLAMDRVASNLDLASLDTRDALVVTEVAVGNGHYNDILDVVYVTREQFDRGKTPAIAAEVSALNRKLLAEKRRYLLIGPGRWGSSDRWLGIPVQWTDISEAAVHRGKANLVDFKVTPSQGTHFFQNLTSFQIGNLTVNQSSGGGHLDWDWLDQESAIEETRFLRHIRFLEPVQVLIDGQTGRAAVFKPGSLLPGQSS